MEVPLSLHVTFWGFSLSTDDLLCHTLNKEGDLNLKHKNIVMVPAPRPR